MSKVLIFTDIHIHTHKRSAERLEDCLKALEWVFETALKHNIKNILFLGDLFHDRQRIEAFSYIKAYQIFEKYFLNNAPFDIYLLFGNHDLWFYNKWDVSSVIPLRAFPNVHTIEKPCTVEIEGYPVSFLPYTHNPIADLQQIKNDSKYKILCGHLAVDGAILNSAGSHAEVSIEHDGEMVKVGGEIFAEWNQVFLGHYHAAQLVNKKVEYIGSPLELSFGEAFQEKHILIYDLETHEKEYVVNNFSPKHLIVKQQDLANFSLENNFVRVIVDDFSDSNIVNMRHELKQLAPSTLEIEQSRKQEKKEEKIVDAKAILANTDEMLKKYIEAKKNNNQLNDLDEEKLLKIGEFVCQTAMAAVG